MTEVIDMVLKNNIDKLNYSGLTLSNVIKNLINQKKYDICYKVISNEMKKNPHDAKPHNFMGILMEKTGDHIGAMKHFRASIDLDPTYLPARYNIENFGSFCLKYKVFYDEDDIIQ